MRKIKVSHEVDGYKEPKAIVRPYTCGRTEYTEYNTLEEMPQQNVADSMLKRNFQPQNKIKFLGTVSKQKICKKQQ